MSLKLGNINIAGTQVLYSTTGNNTDGAMTQKATTTELNNCVHKTDNETISGNKLFEDALKTKGGLDVINDSVVKGTIPSSTKYWGLFRADDANYTENWQNTRLGIGELSLNTVGDVQLMLGVYKNEASSNENSTISIKFNANGTKYVTAPASDVNNSIVTTVAKSKSQNGYVKLGNGIIIQWGRSNQRTITYPIPFSSDTSFSIVVNNQAGTNGYGRPDSVDSLTRTSCMVTSLAEYPVRWIAIGY